jgi:hypothetical protein
MSSGRRSVGVLAAAAGLLAAVWNAFYLWILWHEGEGDLDRANVRYAAASVGLAALVLVLTFLLRSPSVRVAGLAAGALALSGFAVIASLSIGILLVPAALLAWVALDRERSIETGAPHPRAAAAGFVLGAAIPILFLLLLAL